jgi:hypothetical protein
MIGGANAAERLLSTVGCIPGAAVDASRPQTAISVGRKEASWAEEEERWVWLLTAWLPRHDGR